MPWSDDTIEPLFRALYPRVLRASQLVLGERAAAEDVAQEAFARLLLRSPMPADGAERWVFRVARNLAVDRIREVRRLESLPEDGVGGARTVAGGAAWSVGVPDPIGGRDARVEALRAAVAALPARQREVVGLRIYGELSYEAIAATVGRSLGAVTQELHRARAALRERLNGLRLEDDDA